MPASTSSGDAAKRPDFRNPWLAIYDAIRNEGVRLGFSETSLQKVQDVWAGGADHSKSRRQPA